MTDNAPQIAILMTCYNRREVTLRCLQSIREAAAGLRYTVYLVDDGSTDGTSEAIKARYPEVEIIAGDGGLYWNGGMRRAWEAALPAAASYFLWLNDDLDLFKDSISHLYRLQINRENTYGRKVISIGSVVDPADQRVTYGGYVIAPGFSKLRFVRSTGPDIFCDTFNGNCVMIPKCAVIDVGILSPRFAHSSGDIDYGLRARRAGYRLLQSQHAVGQTEYNAEVHAARSRLTWSNCRFILRHPKGVPLKEWFYFCRSHGGVLWPANFIIRYLKMIRMRSATMTSF